MNRSLIIIAVLILGLFIGLGLLVLVGQTSYIKTIDKDCWNRNDTIQNEQIGTVECYKWNIRNVTVD